MDYNEIKKLLDKYGAGETSLEEENLLSGYFAQAEVHTDFEEWKPLFNYFSSEKNLTTSKGFEQKILAQIKQKESITQTFKLYWLRIAAAVLLMIGAAAIIYQSAEKNKIVPAQNIAQATQNNHAKFEIRDTYDNPEDAKKEVERALALISKHMNKGRNIAEKNIGKINILNKALNEN